MNLTTQKMDLLRVHSQDLHEHIAQEVGECLESGAYTDLAVRCAQGQTLHAHKVVLAAVSPYLQWVSEKFSHYVLTFLNLVCHEIFLIFSL